MYRFVEHQADIALELQADSREGLFRAALDALKALLVPESDQSKTSPETAEKLKYPLQYTSIKASGYDDEERLIGLMNEFLYLCQVKDALPLDTKKMTFDDRGCVTAELATIPKPPDLQFQREVKAATYHDVQIESGEVWRVRIVLDV